jgi:glutaredoxin
MKFVRWFLGKIILFFDRVFAPKPVARAREDQARIDAAAAPFEIYQFEACPFCVKVRRHLRAANVTIPLRDATREPFRGELLREGGKVQVPCLKISEPGRPVRWLYESGDIMRYLDDQLGLARA